MWQFPLDSVTTYSGTARLTTASPQLVLSVRLKYGEDLSADDCHGLLGRLVPSLASQSFITHLVPVINFL